MPDLSGNRKLGTRMALIGGFALAVCLSQLVMLGFDGFRPDEGWFYIDWLAVGAIMSGVFAIIGMILRVTAGRDG